MPIQYNFIKMGVYPEILITVCVHLNISRLDIINKSLKSLTFKRFNRFKIWDIFVKN